MAFSFLVGPYGHSGHAAYAAGTGYGLVWVCERGLGKEERKECRRANGGLMERHAQGGVQGGGGGSRAMRATCAQV